MSMQDLGISITARTPIWGGNQRDVDTQLHRKLTSYSHELLANGGYWAAEMEFAANATFAEDWYQHGVGREIIVRNSAGTIIFQGVVNLVTITAGAVTFKRGLLLEITNELELVYLTAAYNTNPPIGGQRQVTAVVSNPTSQAMYGTLHTTLSGGAGSADEMEHVRDMYLADRAWPPTSIDFNLSSSAVPTVKLEVVGYVQFLDKVPYVQTTNAGTENASTKIQNVLTADPNGFWTDFSHIQTNTLQVPQYENEQNTAWSVIKDVVARGDGSGRWVFRVEGDQIPYYEAAPTAVEYTYRLTDQEPQINRGSERVEPWDVRPGKWIMVTDLLIGADLLDLEKDPRTSFIESVRYSSVWGMQINGSKDGRLSQQIAKLGLGGIG